MIRLTFFRVTAGFRKKKLSNKIKKELPNQKTFQTNLENRRKQLKSSSLEKKSTQWRKTTYRVSGKTKGINVVTVPTGLTQKAVGIKSEINAFIQIIDMS